MDTYIDSRFERLEKALTNLIDSVNKYHPSTIQAKELEAADEELTKGLEEIQTHQTNYLRLQQLRSSSAALDTQIKDTLSSLASTRTDITTTHTTTFPAGPSYPVAYDELLNYARRISKTSMPPAGTINPTSTAEPTSPAEAQTPGAGGASAAPTPSQPQSPALLNGGGFDTPTAQSQQQMATQQSTNTSLPEVVNQYLNPLSGQLFFPWPLEDKIRSGALASNQILQEQGVDPKGYDPAEEEERKRKEEEERKEKEEEEKRQLEEKERRMREARERMRRQQEEWRKASAPEASPDRAGPSRSNTGLAEKKQFQFASLDDLDDDDDDDD